MYNNYTDVSYMNEDFLHYLWKYQKFSFSNLTTTTGEELVLKRVGDHNESKSGPDFFNAHVLIDYQNWAGNVEIHVKSSDWYVHHHEIDPVYDNVILHVVWKDDIEVFRRNNSRIPTLQLQDYVEDDLINKYQNIFTTMTRKWLYCEKHITEVSPFTLTNWQERLYIDRLEEKSLLIGTMVRDSSGDWESVLFKLLAKNFGLNVNNDAFLSLANSFDFSVVRKCSHNIDSIEALLFGQSNLLTNIPEEEYVNTLNKEYEFLKHKFSLSNQGVLPFQFFRLRPPNFPTIRISQLANLYHRTPQLFMKLMHADTMEKIYEVFAITTTTFWDTHYTFGKESAIRKKRLTKSFINLVFMNTIVPLKFLYYKDNGVDIEEELFEMMSQLPLEKNTIVDKFLGLGVPIKSALQSQAMIQLKNKYCNQKKCLQCAVGNYLLNQ